MERALTCLLIDDDIDDYEIFCIALKYVNPSITCVYANDGINGLNKLTREPYLLPAFIFIDMNMPRMNGVECLKEIRKIPHLQQVPVYMYSTAADPAIIATCRQLGATGFIKKSVSMAELENTLSTVLFNYKLPE